MSRLRSVPVLLASPWGCAGSVECDGAAGLHGTGSGRGWRERTRVDRPPLEVRYDACQMCAREPGHRNSVDLCLARMPPVYYSARMKSLTVRLPEALVAEIEAESRVRKRSKSDVVRERLKRHEAPTARGRASLEAIADLIGSVDGLPVKLSSRRKAYLRKTRYGSKRPR